MPYKSDSFLREYQRVYYQRRKDTHRRTSVTLTGREHSSIARVAKRDKRSVSGQVKAMALAYLKAEQLVPGDVRGSIDDLVRQLRAIGNNINQIARSLNVKAGGAEMETSEKVAERILFGIYRGLEQVERKVEGIGGER